MARVRIARTRDGRYVPDTDPDAVVLAYSGDEGSVPADIRAKMQSGPAQDKQRKRKPRKKVAKKAAAPPPQVAPQEATEATGSSEE